MKTDDDFAVFILTHGRPKSVVTYPRLRKAGYTGKIYIVIDNEDSTADEYRKWFGDEVIQFDKVEIGKTFDIGDNAGDRRTITFARNASFGIARDLGLTYFMQLDDDYVSFITKFTPSGRFKERKIKGLDEIFSALVEYYKSIPALSIAMAQNGDYLGGAESPFPWGKSRRKAMNSFICSVNRPFQFVGRMDEDVCTYTSLGFRGELFMTVPQVAVIQSASQGTAGGISEMYEACGTYWKSFYAVMFSPSSVKVAVMNSRHSRIHHHVSWVNTVPQIIDEKYKKTSGG